jgi:hypothetical protein
MDGGIMDGRWRDIGDDDGDGDDDGETSVAMQGARTEFLVPNRGIWWWRRSGTLSRKNTEPPMFSG